MTAFTKRQPHTCPYSHAHMAPFLFLCYAKLTIDYFSSPIYIKYMHDLDLELDIMLVSWKTSTDIFFYPFHFHLEHTKNSHVTELFEKKKRRKNTSMSATVFFASLGFGKKKYVQFQKGRK